ncbi:hypothetical protein GCK72_000451 [Caenorhabditis remanei]|uniref:Uncharacterized protein n=1 Tax=Caenorhabditis remanei TaxID=31234 RepID=A0A6A5HM34_CAERE|nr:hypothetical protein GCK72_000451 [Caenorhabditis remanei]KAF1768639.1 hypothetical protein GCK72_000451 [Caenorhabditis remanei]
MRLPILLLILAVMATATIYWKHPVKDARQQAEYQLQYLIHALNMKDIELFKTLAYDVIQAQPIIKLYATGNTGYVMSASNIIGDRHLVATGNLEGTDIKFYFSWEKVRVDSRSLWLTKVP